MKKIILITSYFPYYPGEQFLESEINYWASTNNIELILMPIGKSAIARSIPKNISLDKTFIPQKNIIREKILYVFKTFGSKVFYYEIVTQIFKNLNRFFFGLKAVIKYIYFRDGLQQFLNKNQNSELVFYTYWHTEITYALQSLKEEYNFKLVTRTHRFDIYEEAREFKYMPLRRQFINNIDKIFTITDGAKKYLMDTYGYNKHIIDTARLGVSEHNIICPSNLAHIFQIVSCSFLSEVKQIDKLIDAISIMAKMNTQIEIIWTHIGSGKLESTLKNKAISQLKNRSNVTYEFLGELQNEQIFQFYNKHNVDVFINVSSSEGVPVSIMEAMSCSIPIIAPDVGGISEMLIDGYNGILLPSIPTAGEISEALGKTSFFKKEIIRKKAYEIYKKNYDAQVNYPNFIKRVLEI
ncbi:MAG: glycosyltransferase [Epsilonproteobacteria bacterium]|nr:glycosyltransferase [Campylobacterota bacterium]